MMKYVELYARGICNTTSNDKQGRYASILSYRRTEKIISGIDYNTTSNKMIILGITEGIRALKEPCKVNIFTHGFFWKRDKETRKKGIIGELKITGRNKELLQVLSDEISKGGHIVNFKISNKNQDKLIKILRSSNHK